MPQFLTRTALRPLVVTISNWVCRNCDWITLVLKLQTLQVFDLTITWYQQSRYEPWGVGSNPAGRANQIKGLQRCKPFFATLLVWGQGVVQRSAPHSVQRRVTHVSGTLATGALRGRWCLKAAMNQRCENRSASILRSLGSAVAQPRTDEASDRVTRNAPAIAVAPLIQCHVVSRPPLL